MPSLRLTTGCPVAAAWEQKLRLERLAGGKALLLSFCPVNPLAVQVAAGLAHPTDECKLGRVLAAA